MTTLRRETVWLQTQPVVLDQLVQLMFETHPALRTTIQECIRRDANAHYLLHRQSAIGLKETFHGNATD